MKCTAVIPCFNEETSIGPLVSKLLKYIALVVVVDDGSEDETAQRAENAGAMVIRHERNCGKGAALRAGLSRLFDLGFEWAATLDGDGQHDPADLPAFLRCARQSGASLIIGNRMARADAMPWLRRRVNRWMSQKLSQSAGRELPDTQCGFRLIHVPTWTSLHLSAGHFEVESEMTMAFLAAGHPVEFVPVRCIAGVRKSRIRPLTDTLRWWKWWRQMKTELPGPRTPLPYLPDPCCNRAKM